MLKATRTATRREKVECLEEFGKQLLFQFEEIFHLLSVIKNHSNLQLITTKTSLE